MTRAKKRLKRPVRLSAISVKFDPRTLDILDGLARIDGGSRSEQIRRAVLEYVARRLPAT